MSDRDEAFDNPHHGHSDRFRAFLVDPNDRTVTEVSFEAGDGHSWRKLLGLDPDDSLDHAILSGLRGDPTRLCVFVDGAGYYRQPPPAWWRFDGYPNPLAGPSLVYGCNEFGETVDVPGDVEGFYQRVIWLGVSRPTLPKSQVLKGGEVISEVDHNAPDAPTSQAEYYKRMFPGEEPKR
jgi:hypothetical protein